jgi:Xaa-Pro aminopeptidase
MAAVRVITQGLVKLGLLKGRVAKLEREGAYRRFFMHRTGHWLGMDVHDVGDYKIGDEWRVLEPGMVMTIEPGIYIPASTRGVPKRMRNIGVRIEDDVVVTRTGVEVLTSGAPKTVEAIEALMSGGDVADVRLAS